jgi:hypothetical protein
MKRRVLRSLGVVFLALLFVQSSAWGALQLCPQHSYNPSAAAFDHDGDARSEHVHAHGPDGVVPTIHCAPMDTRLSPAARAYVTEISRSNTATAPHNSVVSTEVYFAVKDQLWLAALFRHSTSSLTVDPSRHLRLSVLRI